MVAISAVYRGFQVAKRLYQYSKPVIKGESFVSKFPPQHRKTVRTILRGSEIAFTGGLVSDILKDALDGTGMTPNGIPQRFKSPSRKQHQAYSRNRRFAKRSRYVKCKPCNCGSKRRYNNFQTRRY